MNDKQATIKGLLMCGLREVNRSSKYRCFEETNEGLPARTFLVGKSGALRVIRAGDSQISQSVSVTGTFQHKALQYIGRLGTDHNPEQCREIYAEFLIRPVGSKTQ